MVHELDTGGARGRRALQQFAAGRLLAFLFSKPQSRNVLAQKSDPISCRPLSPPSYVEVGLTTRLRSATRPTYRVYLGEDKLIF